MNQPYDAVVNQLTDAGFREVESGCFVSPTNPRVIGLAVCAGDPELWRRKAEDILRNETMRVAPNWSRYVVLLIEHEKISDLGWAAAAFAQDVSKCRRMILFANQSSTRPVTLPFISLPSLDRGADAQPRDVDVVVRACLPANLADAFLNEDVAATDVQKLAEEEQL